MSTNPSVRSARACLLLCWSAGLLQAGAADGPLPLGHRDFYPSPERTVGHRGDGNGHFPGATVVDGFCEGTPVQVDSQVPAAGYGGKKPQGKAWDFQDDRSHNIVWKTRLPSWANSQPIVVGDRVFCTGEPDRLICCDARTGAVLWTARANVWEIAGLESEAAQRAHRLFDILNEAVPGWGGMWGGGTCSRLVPSEEMRGFVEAWAADAPRVLQALQQADPVGRDWEQILERDIAALRSYVEKLAALEASGGKMPRLGLDKQIPGDFDFLRGQLTNRISKEIGSLPGASKQYPGPKSSPPWGNMVGYATPVPVSDGRHVYASFGQGQTVCYSLDGKRVWAAYRPQQGEGSRMSHHQSMRLASGVLVDMHGGSDTVAGLDAATGGLLWEAPTKGDHDFGKGGGYYVASSIALPLQNGDRTEHVLVTQRNNIIRIRDGKVLGPLPFAHGSSGGPSLSFSGDIVYRMICGDGCQTPLAAFRLSLAGDELTVTELWETGKPIYATGYEPRVALPGHYLLRNREATGYVAETGQAFKVDGRFGGDSDLVVGSTWLWVQGGMSGDPVASQWGWRRWDGKALALFGAADVADPTRPRPLETRMIIGDDRFPNIPLMQVLTPTLHALPNYGYHIWGKPMHSVYAETCMYPQGDRLFVRTVASLYCIGDPARPWHTPEGAPAVARTE